MKTLKLYLDKDRENSIKTAAEILKNGGIVAIPTETVYGLAANACDTNAIKSVFNAKGRPQDNPLIVHIDSMEMLSKVAKDIPQKAYACAEKFWPGPFTMVLEASDYVSKSVSAGLSTVAVRMPSDETARAVISESKLPLAAPSANISGSPSPVTAEHVVKDLDGKIDAVIMGERCTVGVESTVVAIEGENARLLRPGAVTVEMLREVFPSLIVDKAILSQPERDEKVASPGMKYKHYAPATVLYLVEGDSEKYCNFVNNKNDGAALCFKEEADKIKSQTFVFGNEKDEEAMAYELFEMLRRLDEKNIKKAYVHAPSKSGVGLAVYNRLIRACAFRVVKL
ncbi:MAG: L-threonylcarbamoyladenylate synthase [Acutalibacteraceae bacterium]|nr:L-threonylcarbamoyladenylate synthase [Acutalibacteraceae bacterium]